MLPLFKPWFYYFVNKFYFLKSCTNFVAENDSIVVKKISVYFNANELCHQDECSTCDVDATVNLFLVQKKDTVKVPSIRLNRCSQTLPILYKTITCSQNDFGASGYNFAKYGNIIYNIKELYPYPQTSKELNDFIRNDLYYIKLTALNTCLKWKTNLLSISSVSCLLQHFKIPQWHKHNR